MVTRYRIYSSVTGKMLTEIDAAGQKMETHVYSIGGQEHRQMKAYSIKTSLTTANNFAEQIVSEYSDPKGTRARQWDREKNTTKDVHMSPVGVANLAIDWAQLKDTFVNNIAAQVSFAQSQSRYPGTRSQLEDPTNPGRGCELDGKSVSCAKLIREGINGGINEDSIRYYHGSGAIQGPGYGGGFGWDSDGVNEEGGLIVGDINGDLIVDINGPGSPSSGSKTKKNEDLPPQIDGKTCILEIRGKEIGATKGLPVVGIHTYILTYTPGNEANMTYFGAGDFDGQLGSRYGAYTKAIASTDFTDPYKWSAAFETAAPCSAMNAGLKVVADKLNGSHVPYQTYPNVSKEATLNSNSFTYTALQYIYSPEVFAGINEDIKGKEKFYYSTPGWGNVLPLNLPPRR